MLFLINPVSEVSISGFFSFKCEFDIFGYFKNLMALRYLKKRFFQGRENDRQNSGYFQIRLNLHGFKNIQDHFI